MNWLNGFKGRVETDVSLANLTWFRLGGPARWLVAPRDREELADLLRRAYAGGAWSRGGGGGARGLGGGWGPATGLSPGRATWC